MVSPGRWSGTGCSSIPQPRWATCLLAQDIALHTNLVGCWAIYPNQAHEFPPPEEFLLQMRANRIRALRTFPGNHHFLCNRISMGSWLGLMLAYRIPLFLSLAYGSSWQSIYDLLAECPELRLVICDHGCWGEDRYFRPLIERYPHVYIDTSRYLQDGGIEAMVRSYGPGRILFGSGFPEAYFGTMMLTLKHAEISEEAKQAVASRNLEHLLAEVAL